MTVVTEHGVPSLMQRHVYRRRSPRRTISPLAPGFAAAPPVRDPRIDSPQDGLHPWKTRVQAWLARLKNKKTPISATTGFLWIVVVFMTITLVATVLMR